MKKNNKIKNVVAVLIAATMITSSLSSCKAFDFFGSSSDSTIDSSVESTDVNEVESESAIVDETESESSDDSSTTTQKDTERETTSKQTTTTTKKSIFDIFTPKTTTTKKTTTTTKAQTSATNNNGTTTSTTKATTTTTKATQAQKTDYSISVNLPLSFNSSKTSQSIYNKWKNSDVEAQGALFGSDYVLLKDSYGGLSLKCSNSDFNNKITAVTSNSSIISITEIKNTFNYTGITLKANGTGKATITASIPNNTKTFSFTVAVVTEDQVISTYEKEAMHLINNYRANAGVSALSNDSGLKSAAKTRARECATTFSHTRPDGSTYAKAFPDKYLQGGWLVNENIAKGYEVPVSACRGWYNSSGHRTTMLSTNYDRAGLAVYIADNGTFYWVLDVAGLSNATVEGGEVSDEDKAIEPVRD